MFGLLPMPVPKITLRYTGGRRILTVNGTDHHVTPGVGGCRPKFVLKDHGIIVKVDNAGASAQGQWDMYHSVDPDDQPYFSVPVAVGEGWIAEAFYADAEYIEYGDADHNEWRRLIDRLAHEYDIVDWCSDQAKIVNGGAHVVIHDYAAYGTDDDDWVGSQEDYESGCSCSECEAYRA